jgi:hypothetical protein
MYVYTYVNTLEISAYGRTAETTDFNGHPIFIYGYDDEKEIFNIADFFRGGKYSFEECSYSEMVAALSSGNTDYLAIGESVPTLNAVQYESSKTFRFDFEYVKQMIGEYINPDKTQTERYSKYVEKMYEHLNWKMSAVIGSDSYQFLSEFAKMYLALRELGVTGIDVRPFHALYDHKVMMCERLDYFLKKGYLADTKRERIREYSKIKENAAVVRGLIMKYNATLNDNIIDRLDDLLFETKDKEIILLKQIFDV